LDILAEESVVGEMQKRLLDGEVDIVILDGGRSPKRSASSWSTRRRVVSTCDWSCSSSPRGCK